MISFSLFRAAATNESASCGCHIALPAFFQETSIALAVVLDTAHKVKTATKSVAAAMDVRRDAILIRISNLTIFCSTRLFQQTQAVAFFPVNNDAIGQSCSGRLASQLLPKSLLQPRIPRSLMMMMIFTITEKYYQTKDTREHITPLSRSQGPRGPVCTDGTN